MLKFLIVLIFVFFISVSIVGAVETNEVKIIDTNFDAPGSDKTNLNGEWIQIKNKGRDPADLTDWSLEDKAGHVYNFPKNFVLEPGKTAKIFTGKGENTKKSLYWNEDYPIWNNRGDTVRLKRAGEVVDKYTMKSIEILPYLLGTLVIMTIVTILFFGLKKKREEPSDFYHKKGKDFEEYVIGLFGKKEWEIEDWTRDTSQKLGRLVKSDRKPDIIVRNTKENKYFAIECKFRSRFKRGKMKDGRRGFGIKWASGKQIDNYYKFEEKVGYPVFVVIGIGNDPKAPEKMFLLPLFKLKYEFSLKPYLEKFERDPKKKFFLKEFL